MNEEKTIYTGYQHEDPKEDDYIFGSYSRIPNIELRPDRDWRGVNPLLEHQAPRFETFACVSEVTSKCEAKLAKQIFGTDENDSARFLAKISVTEENKGNSPHAVAEARRKMGNVKEEVYPTNEAASYDEYYKPITRALKNEAEGRLIVRDFLHDYVPKDPNAIYDALRFGVVGTGVHAWVRDGEFYIHPDGAPYTHYTTIVYAEKNNYFIAEDSYPPFLKKLPWTYPFDGVKRFFIEKKEAKIHSKNWLVDLFNGFIKGR